METRRNNATGEITVKAKDFVAVVSEQGVAIQVDGAIVHEWKPGLEQHSDQPSPRAAGKNRKRGSR